MRKLAVLLLLAASALAQDDAAALFYKGFWLEQAEGKLDEAAALYAQLLKEKPDATEAPRALLGLVRIKVARNEDPKELVAELERRYPAAKEEIEGAKRIVVREIFDFEIRRGDSPITAKLKGLYMQMGNWPEPDRLFLIDLGVAVHPMLAQMLRAAEDMPVRAAAKVLVAQRTPEAYSLLAAALLDDTGLFRSAIVETLRGGPDVPSTVVDALGKLYERSPPRLRAEVVETLVTLASGEGRERAFAVLTRALSDDDPGVRRVALVVIPDSSAPDAYLDAVLRRFEAGDLGHIVGGVVAINSQYLVLFADRAPFRDRIEKILERETLNHHGLPEKLPEDGALLLARKAIRELKEGRFDGWVYHIAHVAARASPRAAGMLLAAALELGSNDTALVVQVRNAMLPRDPLKYLGDEAARLRMAVIALAPGAHEEQREVYSHVLDIVGLTGEDFDAITEGLRRRGARRMPAMLLARSRLKALGPEKAGAMAGFCHDDSELADLLKAGDVFAKREDAGLAFYRQVVPKAGPASANELHDIFGIPALAPLVAERLLKANEPTWGWYTGAPPGPAWGWPKDIGPHGGPYAWGGIDWDQLAAPPLRDLLVPFVEDPRPEVALAAAIAAAADETDTGTEALRRALRSKWQHARGIALKALFHRVPDGIALLREFAKRPGLTEEDCGAFDDVLEDVKGASAAALVLELLTSGKDEWSGLWYAYRNLAPKECVDLALTQATGLGGREHRYEAVRVLTEADDPRRIEVFRALLGGRDGDVIREVLGAVGNQYLVELGPEVLAQLRNPDDEIRELATNAIDKLKFYAEAKKAFEK